MYDFTLSTVSTSVFYVRTDENIRFAVISIEIIHSDIYFIVKTLRHTEAFKF